MTLSTPIRKIYQGVADRRQLFRMFDRHAQCPNRWQDDAGPLYAGEWFEIAQPEHDYMCRFAVKCKNGRFRTGLSI